MSFLPANIFNLEMMDKVFAEKQERGKQEELFQPKVHKTKCIHVYQRVCFSVFHFDLGQDYRGNRAKSIISFVSRT